MMKRLHHASIHTVFFALGTAFFSLVAACASYQAKPLPAHPTLLKSIPHLVIERYRMPLSSLAGHPFTPDDGLDMTETAILAVINNPELKVSRDERGIARAELVSAGILPNPQLSLGLDHPTNDGPGLVNAWNAGISADIAALVARNAGIASARAEKRSTDLTILWQEWQVVQQARLLFIGIMEQVKLQKELASYRELLNDRYQRERHALNEGDTTVTEVSADLAALRDSDASMNELARKLQKNRDDLKALLGLSPDTELVLNGSAVVEEVDQKQVDDDLAHLSERRPDLLALRAGYEAQEERLRKAVLAQFPALSIGFTRARDTSGIYTTGVGVTLSLPIFDRNQGAIAVEKATRERLYDEYQSRLNSSYSEVNSLYGQTVLLQKQYDDAKRDLPELEKTEKAAQEALTAGNLDIASYVDLRSALLKKRMDIISLEQSLFEERIALRTLLAAELPAQADSSPALEERSK